MPVLWEYMVLKVEAYSGFFAGRVVDTDALSAELNHLGARGWELVSMFEVQTGQGRTNSVNAILKRPRSTGA